MKTTFCNNCGRPGHLFHQCKLPITSFGIILVQKRDKEYEFLMIRRKDSFGYIDFVRGKYPTYNYNSDSATALTARYVQSSIDEMSCDEKQRLVTMPFTGLWLNLWGSSKGPSSHEEISSARKYDMVQSQLASMVANSTTAWTETEWEFPKGKRNANERDIDAALREFEEETGLSRRNIEVISNVMPLDETFVGSNGKTYSHRYFLAYALIPEAVADMTRYQRSEVSAMEWKTVSECWQSMRPYNREKRQLVANVVHLLGEMTLFK